MIKYNNTNNASTTLTAWISPSSTTLIVENGDILPTAPFLLTLEHFDNEKVTVREIVKCITKVGTILTIQRGAWTCVQDDSATPKAQNNTPHSFSVWDVASIYWTSEQVQDIQNEIEKKLNIDDFQAWTYVYGATSTWTDAYSITIPWTLTSYTVWQVFRFMADTENVWNATLNVNWLWEKEILKNHDQHLQSGDIEAGQIVEVAYDGTNFQMDSQIASVISLDDISSLSYNDLTCYAGEDIKENDLIITNWNSFDPDRTDESTDVWGQTVNKYAIWFVGNGESTDTFSIKTSVIEWYEPDSVTINIESDDNWKPSGTALATSTSLDVFKLRTDPANTTSSSISNLYAFYMNTLWEGEWKISYDNSNKVMSISWTRYNYTLDLSSFFPNNTPWLHYKTRDDKYFIFYEAFNKYWLLYLPTPTTIDWATIQNVDSSIIFNGTWLSSDSTLRGLCISDNWNYMFAYAGDFSQSVRKIFKIKLTTPFIVNTYDSFEELTLEYSPYNWNLSIINNFWKNYFVYTKYASYSSETYAQLCELDNNYTIISQNNTWKFPGTQIIPDYRATQTRFYGRDNELLFWYDRDYNGVYKGTITTTTTFDSVKWTKYRLTIAPVKTWSVVDCVKIYDKEGEYYSECAVRDLNSWSNVSDKTPYIDANCILARYALKSNLIDWENKIPRWFANGDYTNLSSVSYCFKWKKSGFQWLEQDTIYYSDNDWKITTNLWPCKVWQTTNDTDLIVNIDFGGKSFSKSYSWKFTDSFKVPSDWYIKYSFTLDHTTYSFVVWKTNVIDTKSGNQGSSANTISLAYTFVPAWTTITLSTRDNNGTASVSWTVDFLSAREN